MRDKITIVFVTASLLYNSPEKLSSNYNDKVKKELEEIRGKSDEVIQRRIFFVDKYPAKTSDFIDVLVENSPNILHFSGRVLLETPTENIPRTISDSFYLTQSLEKVSKKVDCIILSSCFSSALAKTLVPHVCCVIGTCAEIPLETTIEFDRLFYKYLGRGRSLGEAYDLACISLSDLQNKKPDIKCRNDNNTDRKCRQTILYEEPQEYMRVTRSTYVEAINTIRVLVEGQPDIPLYIKTGGEVR
jgi:hypothetical protein